MNVIDSRVPSHWFNTTNYDMKAKLWDQMVDIMTQWRSTTDAMRWADHLLYTGPSSTRLPVDKLCGLDKGDLEDWIMEYIQ